MSHRPRILIFVESAEGFGHFNVVDRLAAELDAHDCDTTIASGSFRHADSAFTFAHSPIVTLPQVPVRAGLLGSGATSAHPPGEDEGRDRWTAVQTVCREFHPSLILFEMYPFRMLYRDLDLEAIEAFYADATDRPAIACLCRDIVHSDDAAASVARLNRHFDRIMVRGDGIANRLADCMPEFCSITIPIEYLGSIVAPMPLATMDATERPVVVFAGGGHRARDGDFFAAAMRARAASQTCRHRDWHLFVSKNCAEEEFGLYESLGREHGVTVHRPWSSQEFRQLLANSFAAIIRGGYNSSHELTAAAVPFLTIPRESLGTNEEQAMRARLVERAGHGVHVPEAHLDRPDIDAILAGHLDRIALEARRRPGHTAIDGSKVIAERLRSLAVSPQGKAAGRRDPSRVRDADPAEYGPM